MGNALMLQDRTSVGRLPENGVALPHPSVSDRHATILRTDGGWQAPDGSRPEVLTLRQLCDAVETYAGWYAAHGVKPRDPVAVHSYSSAENAVNYLALTSLGAIPSLVNGNLRPEIAREYVRRQGAVGAFTDAEHHSVLSGPESGLGFSVTDRMGGGPFLRPAGTPEHHTLFMIATPPFMKGIEHFTFHMGGPTEVVVAGTRFVALSSPFPMKRGEALHGARIAYETWGRLDADASNAVLILTGLSPSAHAASNEGNPEPGWWEAMLGPGKPIDTDRWFVVCVNSLGSCKGSTGPASVNPATGALYRLDFPDLSIEDGANAAVRLEGGSRREVWLPVEVLARLYPDYGLRAS